jgi:WD40 repeat protein
MKRRVLRGRLIDGIWSEPTEWEMPDPSNHYLRRRSTRVFDTAGLATFSKKYGTIAIWDLANDELLGEYAGLYTFDLDSHRRVLAVGNLSDIKKDGHFIGTSAPGGRLISLETGNETQLDKPSGSILSILRFEPHSQRLVGLDEAGRLFVWDGTDGRLLGEIENHYGRIYGIDTIANHLVCKYENGRLAVLDLDERKPSPFRKESIPFLRHPAGKPTKWTTANLAGPQVLEHIQPGIRRLYEDRMIPWQLPNELRGYPDNSPPVVHLNLSPNGRFLAVQTREDKRFRVYDLRDNNRIVREDVATAFNAGARTFGLSNAVSKIPSCLSPSTPVWPRI